MKKILVVDNDKLILEFIRDLLEENGHEAVLAEDGLDALDILKTYIPDIILSDLIMPNIDGRKLCRAVRKMARHKTCCIAVMSALAAEEKLNIEELGADILIAKGALPDLGQIVLSVVEHPEENRLKCRKGHVLGAEQMWPRKITQELLSAKQHVEMILERMKEGILEIEEDGRIVSANAQALSLTGRSETDLLGTKIISFFASEHQDQIRDLLSGKKKAEKEISEECPVSFCKHLVTLNIIPLQDHAVVIINDITERKRKEKELRESQDRFRFLVDNMLDAAVIVDRKGKTLFANNAAAKLIGLDTPGHLLGKQIADFIHHDSMRTAIRNYLKVNRRLGQTLTEYKIITPNGEEKDIEGLGTDIMFNGMPAHILTLRDITARKQAEEQIRQGIVRLSKNLEEAVISLASAFEMKDPYTAGHQRRVTDIACAIARKMAIDDEQYQGLRLASLVHDIGKINVPAEILSKPGKLTQPEMDLIRSHSEAGYNILKKINFPWPIAQIVRQHHERLDGSGYPLALMGDEILMEARIIAVADVIEAMASHRPYRPSLGIEKALQEIEANQGILYDEAVVEVCMDLFRSGKFRIDI